MDIALLVVDNNNPITVPSNFTDFCKYTRSSKLGCKLCDDCHLKNGKVARKKNKSIIYTCHAGLTNFATPFVIKGKYLTTLLGGQILLKPQRESFLSKKAKELGLEEKEYLSKANKLRIISKERFKAITEASNLFVNGVSSIYYANYKLAELGMDYKISKNLGLEQWLFLNCEINERPITEREFEVLRLIVLGKSNTEIAKELFISVHTVKAHVSSILEKFAVEDRVQVAVKAIREGLI